MKRQTAMWLLAATWLGVIYSTLYVARTVAESLRAHNLLRLTVWLVVGATAVAVVAWAVRSRTDRRGWAVLALGAAGFLWGITSVSPAEVKLHFVEYGILGGLFYSALRSGGVRWKVVPAILLTGVAGWVDEGIQYLLPNRWYDLQDVAINSIAGVLAIATLALLDRARAKGQTPATG